MKSQLEWKPKLVEAELVPVMVYTNDLHDSVLYNVSITVLKVVQHSTGN